MVPSGGKLCELLTKNVEGISPKNGNRAHQPYRHSSKYLLLCSAEERNSYRFGKTLGGVINDRIFIFGGNISLHTYILLFFYIILA